MGRWGTLAVTGLIMLLFVVVSPGVLCADHLDDGTIQLTTMRDDALMDDPQGTNHDDDQCSTSVERIGPLEGQEWRQIAEGNNTTTPFPWGPYVIIGMVVVFGGIAIGWSIYIFKGERRERLEEALRVSEDWGDIPRISTWWHQVGPSLFIIFLMGFFALACVNQRHVSLLCHKESDKQIQKAKDVTRSDSPAWPSIFA